MMDDSMSNVDWLCEDCVGCELMWIGDELLAIGCDSLWIGGDLIATGVGFVNECGALMRETSSSGKTVLLCFQTSYYQTCRLLKVASSHHKD